MFNSPCQGCNQRQVGCHSHCEAYLKTKAAHEESKRSRKAQTQAERMITARMLERMDSKAKKLKERRIGQR